jgi:hypothetical protein
MHLPSFEKTGAGETQIERGRKQKWVKWKQKMNEVETKNEEGVSK